MAPPKRDRAQQGQTKVRSPSRRNTIIPSALRTKKRKNTVRNNIITTNNSHEGTKKRRASQRSDIGSASDDEMSGNNSNKNDNDDDTSDEDSDIDDQERDTNKTDGTQLENTGVSTNSGKNANGSLILSLTSELEKSKKTCLLLHSKINDINECRQDQDNIIAALKEQVEEYDEEMRELRAEKKKSLNTTALPINLIQYDQVGVYVKRYIFKKVKFTIDKTLDSVAPGSIGFTIANAFNIAQEQLVPWWSTYKQAAHQGVGQTRNGKMTEVKKAFKSKCKRERLYCILHHHLI